MKLTATTRLAVAALLRAKLRSLLTTLGVVIGVAAVIIMQSMGAGATALVTGELSGMGSNMLMLVPGATQGMGGASLGAPLFTHDDLEAIRRECTAVRYATVMNVRSSRVVAGAENRSTNLYGVSPEYFEIRQWYPSMGRVLTADDERQGAKVCVIGDTNRLELFGAVDPVGAEIRVHETACRVVGVLEAKGASTFGQDQDDLVLMPASTYSRRVMGDDRFVFRTGDGSDRIVAFVRGEDHIDFTVYEKAGGGDLAFADLTLTPGASSVVVTVGDLQITVDGVTALSEDDFLF